MNTTEHADFAIRDEGSVVLLWAISDEAMAWVEDHLPADRQTFGGAVAIEHRYAPAIIAGMADDGLVGRIT